MFSPGVMLPRMQITCILAGRVGGMRIVSTQQDTEEMNNINQAWKRAEQN